MAPGDGRVVSNFIIQALQGVDITMHGEGKQTRSFCYVDDLIDGLIAVMESEAAGPGPINLGNPHEFTIRELAELVLSKTTSQSRMTFRPMPEDDPTQRQPDIARARDLLGWEPKVPLAEGLDPTIAYYREVLDATPDVAAPMYDV